jgi:hypothetical protein
VSRRDELLALASKVEALDGPDRDVDARICVALGLSKDNVMVGVDGWCINSATNPNPYKSPAYTASLDAAMSLVPVGCLAGFKALWADADVIGGAKVYRGSVDRHKAHDGLYWKDNFLSLAATPALALTAAALKALAEQEQ